jgi:hypothetical protein
MTAGRIAKHREETTIDEMTWAILKKAGFDFAPRMREFLEGQAKLHLAALGATEMSPKLRKEPSRY